MPVLGNPPDFRVSCYMNDLLPSNNLAKIVQEQRLNPCSDGSQLKRSLHLRVSTSDWLPPNW